MNIEDLYINKTNEYKRFALALVFNDAYVPGAFVFLKTFLKYNPWYNGDIVCFYDNEYCCISEENQQIFKSLYPNLYFKFIDYKLYNKFVDHFQEKMMYKRFIVSAYTVESFALKYDQNGNEYDRVVYLDIDQIVEGDLSLLFYNNEDIVVAPGDNYLINDISKTLYFRDNKNITVSGGLFSISKKYLGEKIRNSILKFGETFEFDKPEYGVCDGKGFEMHVLDIWLRDKNTWFVSSIYAFPSFLMKNIYSEPNFESIKFNLFRNAKIIHLWGDKPWCKTNNDFKTDLDLYWENIYKDGNETLVEFFKNILPPANYVNDSKYKIITNFM